MRVAHLVICILLLSLSGLAQGPGELKALLVGISEYQRERYWGPIHGIEDAQALGELLQDRFLAKEENLKMLLGSKATRAQIDKALDSLVDSADKGDTVLLYYSGHGNVVPDQEGGDEEDGVDECLIPFDCGSYRSKKYPDSVIRDDRIRAVSESLKQRVGTTGQVVLIFDSCHSGTMNRDVGKMGLVGKTVVEVELPESIDGSMSEVRLPGVAVLTACQADEVAGDDAKMKGGLFTRALVEALGDSRLAPQSDYRHLMARIRADGVFYGQNPRFEGDWNLTVFGGRARPLPTSARLLDADGWLDRGTLAGLFKGSVMEIDGLKGKVVESMPRRARVLFEKAPDESLVGQKVELVRQSSGVSEVKICFLGKSETKIPNGFIVTKEPRDTDFLIGAGENGDRTISTRTETFVIPNESLTEWLERLARRRSLMRLLHRPDKLSLTLTPGHYESLEKMQGFKPARLEYDEQGVLVVKAGQHVRARLKNESSYPMHFEIVDFDSDGTFGPLARFGAYLQPGGSIDRALIFSPTSRTLEGLKLVGSRVPLDLSGAASRSDDPPLRRFITSTLRGQTNQEELSSPDSYAIGETIFVRCR